MILVKAIAMLKKNLSVKTKEILKSIVENILVLFDYFYDVGRYY